MGAELFYADRQRDGLMDGHDEANSRFSQFYKCALNTLIFYRKEIVIDRIIHPLIHRVVKNNRYVSVKTCNTYINQ